MKGATVCKECLRASRTPLRTTRASGRFLSTPATSSIRSLSTYPPRCQQQSSPEQKNAQPSPPHPASAPTPTTTPTTPASSSPEPSAAQMQAAIRSNLTHSPTMVKLAHALRRVSKSTTDTYIIYGYAEAFYKSCAAQAPYTIPSDQRTQVISGIGPPKTTEGEDIGVPDETSSNVGSVFWHEQLGLLPTFSTWSQVTYLHFYILLVHLRTIPDYRELQMHQRYLLEHFSQNAEDKMVLLHTIDARGIRNRYLKDLFTRWLGCIAAYDEGMVRGDAILGAAVWRNLWKGEEQVDWEKVGVVVAYMRRCINMLGEFKDITQMRDSLDGPQGVWARAKEGLFEVVQKESQGVKEPL